MGLKKYFRRRPGFNSQHPYGSSKKPVTPVPEDPTSSSGICGYCIYMVYRHVCRQNTHTNKLKI